MHQVFNPVVLQLAQLAEEAGQGMSGPAPARADKVGLGAFGHVNQAVLMPALQFDAGLAAAWSEGEPVGDRLGVRIGPIAQLVYNAGTHITFPGIRDRLLWGNYSARVNNHVLPLFIPRVIIGAEFDLFAHIVVVAGSPPGHAPAFNPGLGHVFTPGGIREGSPNSVTHARRGWSSRGSQYAHQAKGWTVSPPKSSEGSPITEQVLVADS